MKKVMYLLIGIIMILIIMIGGYLYYKYETEYINGINPYQKEINKILGVNEPVFNSINAKEPLKPVYGAIINAYEFKTYQALNIMVMMNPNDAYSPQDAKIRKKQSQEAREVIEKNQAIIKKMIEFSEKNNIDYLNANQFKQFYESIQKVINSNFNMEISKEEDNRNKQFFSNKEFKEISEGYMNDIQKSTKKYPNLKKDGKYYLAIWNNAFIAFSNKNINERPIEFNTVDI